MTDEIPDWLALIAAAGGDDVTHVYPLTRETGTDFYPGPGGCHFNYSYSPCVFTGRVDGAWGYWVEYGKHRRPFVECGSPAETVFAVLKAIGEFQQEEVERIRRVPPCPFCGGRGDHPVVPCGPQRQLPDGSFEMIFRYGDYGKVSR